VADKEKERDWDREMREVDKLLKKLPEADPTLGRGVPTVPRAYPAQGGGHAAAAAAAGPASARARLTTWFRVGLGVLLGVGMLAWPYSYVCGAKLLLYLVGVGTLIVAGAWGALSSWRRRMGLAHVVALLVLLWGTVLTVTVVLPRIGDAGAQAIWFCPEPPVQVTPNR
jgi:hypothetical protein